MEAPFRTKKKSEGHVYFPNSTWLGGELMLRVNDFIKPLAKQIAFADDHSV